MAIRQRLLWKTTACLLVTFAAQTSGTAEESNTPQSVTLKLPGGIPLEMVRIPAGSFLMGSSESERGRYDNEGPVHEVKIACDFYMGRFPVTQAQFKAVMGTLPALEYGAGDDYPIYNVPWKSVAEPDGFCAKLNDHLVGTGQGGAPVRLPSEAEWEYACRAGTTTRFYFGDSLGAGDGPMNAAAGATPGMRSDYMWFFFGDERPVSCQPVGLKRPNAFGLYDMHGNVWEFCQDRYHPNYVGAPADGGAWEDGAEGPQRVVRGGSWYFYSRDARSACRTQARPGRGNNADGFRIVRDGAK